MCWHVHRYGLLIEPGQYMKWYVDDLLVFELDQTGLSTKTNPSNSAETVGQRQIPTEPMYMALGVSSLDPSAVALPAEMGVDYVRLYQGSGHTLTCDPTRYATAQYVAANQATLGVSTCGNGVCDAGECEQCPRDCRNAIACRRDCLVPQCQTRDPTFLTATEWTFLVSPRSVRPAHHLGGWLYRGRGAGPGREVIECPHTVGGGGANPLWTPPPLQTKVTSVGKAEIYRWEKLMGPVLVHKLLGPRPAPPFCHF